MLLPHAGPSRAPAGGSPPPSPPRPPRAPCCYRLLLSHVPASSWRSDVTPLSHQYGPGLPSELSSPSACCETCTTLLLRRSLLGVRVGSPLPPPLSSSPPPCRSCRVLLPSLVPCRHARRTLPFVARIEPAGLRPLPLPLVRVTAVFWPIYLHFKIDGGHVGTPDPLFQSGSEEPLASASPSPCRSASWFEFPLIFRGDVSDVKIFET